MSVVLHLALGWEWTALAAVAVGLAAGKRGWLYGAAAVVLGWGALVTYSFVIAPHATATFARTFGEILGNLPAAGTVALTLLIAGLIGALGGSLGSLLLQLRPGRTRRRSSQLIL